jgi:hypothetical protein
VPVTRVELAALEELVAAMARLNCRLEAELVVGQGPLRFRRIAATGSIIRSIAAALLMGIVRRQIALAERLAEIRWRIAGRARSSRLTGKVGI